MFQPTIQFQRSKWYWQKDFFLLLDKNLPKTHKFYKIFNWNDVKVSYSSMPNISSIIKSHNKKVLSNDESNSWKSSCNCRHKSSCPLNGNCLQQNVICCSKIIPKNEYTNKSHPCYIGSTENSFKDRLYKHKTLLNMRINERQQNCLILYGTRRAKTLMCHSNGAF